jgi:nuclear pore complex protein Nup54
MKYIQILRNKGYSIRAEEEVLRSRLEALEKEFTRSSVFKGKFLEIYTQIRSLSDSIQYAEIPDSYSLVNEASLEAISEVLCLY